MQGVFLRRYLQNIRRSCIAEFKSAVFCDSLDVRLGILSKK
jgi:hypothetical protein